jgi:hypothetical protein
LVATSTDGIASPLSYRPKAFECNPTLEASSAWDIFLFFLVSTRRLLNPDHQKSVKDLAEKKKAEHPDKQIVQEGKIRTDGSNRNPDVQVVNPQTGKVEEVHEVERHPNRKRNKEREAEYKRLEIQNQTHPIKTGG